MRASPGICCLVQHIIWHPSAAAMEEKGAVTRTVCLVSISLWRESTILWQGPKNMSRSLSSARLGMFCSIVEMIMIVIRDPSGCPSSRDSIHQQVASSRHARLYHLNRKCVLFEQAQSCGLRYQTHLWRWVLQKKEEVLDLVRQSRRWSRRQPVPEPHRSLTRRARGSPMPSRARTAVAQQEARGTPFFPSQEK
jgi:hypothetical protein